MIELKSGNLNEVSLVEGRDSHLLVLRKPQSRANIARTMAQVMVEHEFEGFFDNPSSRIGMRSPVEQVTFAQRLRYHGIPTPGTFLRQTGEQLIDYIPDVEKLYDLWLKQDPRAADTTPEVFRVVMMAHEEDLVPGDVTGKNELVTPEAEVALIDFDIRLFGPEAREFEYANLMYRLSRAAHRGSPRQLPVLGDICKDTLCSRQVRSLYDRTTLLRYMHRFAWLSTGEGSAKLHGMTPIIRPEYSAELFHFLIEVLECSIHQSE
ncbi:hypothetical protein HYW41_04840 [Candidatus Daviesbacteria bacterium]|nr:hypothetical protein [Candidatus Daviesbacteria bacterium]